MSNIKDLAREIISSYARSLWLRRGPFVQSALMSYSGTEIMRYEVTDYLGRRDWTPLEFSGWLRNREKTADGALSLWVSPRNIPQAWFRHAEPVHIRAMARRMASQVLVEHPQYRERHGSRVIAAPGSTISERDSSVADAAQWLWMNREAASVAWCARVDSDYILKASKLARSYSERLDVKEKKYSLSDLGRAYDLGFSASGEGWNQEIHPDYLDKENYQAERSEALREFK